MVSPARASDFPSGNSLGISEGEFVVARPQTKESFEKERKTLNALYDRFEVGVEQKDMSSGPLGVEIGVGDSAAKRHITLFEDLGILGRRMEYGNMTTNGLAFGRHYHWTLLVPKEDAIKRLSDSQAQRETAIQENVKDGARRGSAKRYGKSRATAPTETVVVADDASPEETRAISGPEPDRHLGSLMNETVKSIRKDDAAALIEAARQYANRTSSITAKIDELAKVAAEVGVTFDRAKAAEAVSYEPDERLEVVAQLLPYIDRIERSLERVSNQLVEQSGKVRDYDQMKVENRRLRERIEHLISNRVAAQQASLRQ